jgi:hypothetical protein
VGGREAARRPSDRSPLVRARALRDAEEPHVERTIELGPRAVETLSDQWQASLYKGDEELVFGHPALATPLDPTKLARDYLRPRSRALGSRSRSARGTTFATRR